LFILPLEFDLCTVGSAAHLVHLLQASGRQATILAHPNWPDSILNNWPQEWFTLPDEHAYELSQRPETTWLWGISSLKQHSQELKNFLLGLTTIQVLDWTGEKRRPIGDFFHICPSLGGLTELSFTLSREVWPVHDWDHKVLGQALRSFVNQYPICTQDAPLVHLIQQLDCPLPDESELPSVSELFRKGDWALHIYRELSDEQILQLRANLLNLFVQESAINLIVAIETEEHTFELHNVHEEATADLRARNLLKKSFQRHSHQCHFHIPSVDGLLELLNPDRIDAPKAQIALQDKVEEKEDTKEGPEKTEEAGEKGEEKVTDGEKVEGQDAKLEGDKDSEKQEKESEEKLEEGKSEAEKAPKEKVYSLEAWPIARYGGQHFSFSCSDPQWQFERDQRLEMMRDIPIEEDEEEEEEEEEAQTLDWDATQLIKRLSALKLPVVKLGPLDLKSAHLPIVKLQTQDLKSHFDEEVLRFEERQQRRLQALLEGQKRKEKELLRKREQEEKERVEAKAKAEREEAERLKREEAERIEAEKLAQEAAEELARQEQERIEAEQKEQAEKEAAEREEQERIAAEKEAAEKELERVEAERIEIERIEIERLEQERIEAERIEAEKAREEEDREESEEEARQRFEREEAEELARLEAEEKELEELERQELEELERLEAEKEHAVTDYLHQDKEGWGADEKELEDEELLEHLNQLDEQYGSPSKSSNDPYDEEEKLDDSEGIDAPSFEMFLDEEDKKAQEEAEQKILEAQNAKREAKEAAKREEKERLERIEAERLEQEERERIAAEKELERIEAERLEQERAEAACIEAERLEQERAEAARIEAERLEQERAEAARIEAERLEQEKVEAARIEAERLEQERAEAERIEAERLEQEKVEAERIEAERLEQERAEAARIEAERLEQESIKAEPESSEDEVPLTTAEILQKLEETAELLEDDESDFPSADPLSELSDEDLLAELISGDPHPVEQSESIPEELGSVEEYPEAVEDDHAIDYDLMESDAEEQATAMDESWEGAEPEIEVSMSEEHEQTDEIIIGAEDIAPDEEEVDHDDFIGEIEEIEEDNDDEVSPNHLEDEGQAIASDSSADDIQAAREDLAPEDIISDLDSEEFESDTGAPAQSEPMPAAEATAAVSNPSSSEAAEPILGRRGKTGYISPYLWDGKNVLQDVLDEVRQKKQLRQSDAILLCWLLIGSIWAFLNDLPLL
jgi:hypothetical protein